MENQHTELQFKYNNNKIILEYLERTRESFKKNIRRKRIELEMVKSPPLILGQFLEPIGENMGVVSNGNGPTLVRILSDVNRDELKINCTVGLHKTSSAVVCVVPNEEVDVVMHEKPDVRYEDIGGYDIQKQELREAVELPLLEAELYRQVGIDPPNGVLLYGPPGNGKTMLVKAVANATNATFIKINGSEFVQKYLGEGPRMVRDVFRLAREKAPSIVFIDEIDSIATKRFDSNTSADKEVQRVLIELLSQLDGFEPLLGVKVIMATNRVDTLDPALLRPGRLDRKVEFLNPDRREKRLIFNTIINKMNTEDIDVDPFIRRKDILSCADIASICTEAGILAVRNSRYTCLQEDFINAYDKVVANKAKDEIFYN